MWVKCETETELLHSIESEIFCDEIKKKIIKITNSRLTTPARFYEHILLQI